MDNYNLIETLGKSNLKKLSELNNKEIIAYLNSGLLNSKLKYLKTEYLLQFIELDKLSDYFSRYIISFDKNSFLIEVLKNIKNPDDLYALNLFNIVLKEEMKLKSVNTDLFDFSKTKNLGLQGLIPYLLVDVTLFNCFPFFSGHAYLEDTWKITEDYFLRNFKENRLEDLLKLYEKLSLDSFKEMLILLDRYKGFQERTFIRTYYEVFSFNNSYKEERISFLEKVLNNPRILSNPKNSKFMMNFYDYYKSFPNSEGLLDRMMEAGEKNHLAASFSFYTFADSEDLVKFLNDEENHPLYFEMVSLIESIEFNSNVFRGQMVSIRKALNAMLKVFNELPDKKKENYKKKIYWWCNEVRRAIESIPSGYLYFVMQYLTNPLVASKISLSGLKRRMKDLYFSGDYTYQINLREFLLTEEVIKYQIKHPASKKVNYLISRIKNFEGIVDRFGIVSLGKKLDEIEFDVLSLQIKALESRSNIDEYYSPFELRKHILESKDKNWLELTDKALNSKLKSKDDIIKFLVDNEKLNKDNLKRAIDVILENEDSSVINYLDFIIKTDYFDEYLPLLYNCNDTNEICILTRLVKGTSLGDDKDDKLNSIKESFDLIKDVEYNIKIKFILASFLAEISDKSIDEKKLCLLADEKICERCIQEYLISSVSKKDAVRIKDELSLYNDFDKELYPVLTSVLVDENIFLDDKELIVKVVEDLDDLKNRFPCSYEKSYSFISKTLNSDLSLNNKIRIIDDLNNSLIEEQLLTKMEVFNTELAPLESANLSSIKLTSGNIFDKIWFNSMELANHDNLNMLFYGVKIEDKPKIKIK